ncbi:hypothetical protein GCM10007079_00410 [Nocardiopsis terrae]|nr:hypothetical protein GCM10007079_00410 [Nocardiopsis terrae]
MSTRAGRPPPLLPGARGTAGERVAKDVDIPVLLGASSGWSVLRSGAVHPECGPRSWTAADLPVTPRRPAVQHTAPRRVLSVFVRAIRVTAQGSG